MATPSKNTLPARPVNGTAVTYCPLVKTVVARATDGEKVTRAEGTGTTYSVPLTLNLDRTHKPDRHRCGAQAVHLQHTREPDPVAPWNGRAVEIGTDGAPSATLRERFCGSAVAASKPRQRPTPALGEDVRKVRRVDATTCSPRQPCSRALLINWCISSRNSLDMSTRPFTLFFRS